jgi:hypothetical protein
MKLFKSLLVAPATLGLLAPMSATANEVTISDFTPAEQLAITNSRVDGLEARMNNIEAGSFSETTTASFSADFAIGALDGGTATNDDAVSAGYGFQIDLNTSFTGEDSFDVSLDAGSASASGYAELDLNDANTSLTVDGISYTFPVGDLTVAVGNGIDGSSLYNVACVYGTPSDTMDDCGAPSSVFVGGGTTLAASYDFGNGFSAAAGYSGQGPTAAGLMTQEGLDSYGFNAAYTADTYGVSVSFAKAEILNDAFDDVYTAVNAYWTPEGFPSISAGYEWGDDGSEANDVDGITSYFVGVQFDEIGPGKFGAALGTKTATVEGTDELLMYEAFYSYPVNDSMTITPLVYIKENTTGTEDTTGLMVKTSFKF